MRKKKDEKVKKLSNFIEDTAYSISNEEANIELSRISNEESKASLIEDSDFVIVDSPLSLDALEDYDPYKDFDEEN